FVETFKGLLLCRLFLGFFEAGHWPCALRTTQRILSPSERTLGNSILQSGSSIGSVVTPILVLALLTPERGSWRFAFQIIAVSGLAWVVLWLTAIRARDLTGPVPTDADGPAAGAFTAEESQSFWSVLFTRRFATLLIVVFAINTSWHIFRAWLPMFLQDGR